MNNQFTLIGPDMTVILKALEAYHFENEYEAKTADNLIKLFYGRLYYTKKPTDLTGKCGSCKWAVAINEHCLINCTCPSKNPNFFARTAKACKKYERKL